MASALPPPSPESPGRPPLPWFPKLLPWFVLFVATCLGGILFSRFLDNRRQLWNDAIHDRHAHLYSGMCLAEDVRLGHWGRLPSDLDKFRTWPPLHDGFLVGLSLLLGGEECWAVLPSLLGWIGSAVFAFLLARRAVTHGGAVAGLIAALFVLVSPAQRAFATDVMLESLGACLTLAVVYFYLVSVQDNSRWGHRGLALMLTALFFHKYNYWGLVIVALLVVHFGARFHATIHQVRDWMRTVPWRRWLISQVRHPLTWVLIVLLPLIVLIQATGGTELTVAGRHVSLRSTANLTTIAYLVLMVRVLIWFWRAGRTVVAAQEPRLRALVYWHIAPVALWFLWPQKLDRFLWYASPTTNAGELPQHNLWGGYAFYWDALATDYHITQWSLLLAVGLTALAVVALAARWLRPGAGAIIGLLLIASVLTAHHPNRKSRFVHSWVPLVWVSAGVGAACVLRRRWTVRGWSARPALATAMVGGLVLGHLPGFTAEAHAPEGGIQPQAHSILELTDAYLPHLGAARRVAIFSNMPMKFVTRWSYLQRYHRGERIDTDIPGFNPDATDNRPCFEKWLATTRCDAVVTINLPPGSAFHVQNPAWEGLAQYGLLLKRQRVFQPVSQNEFPSTGAAVTVWKRAPLAADK